MEAETITKEDKLYQKFQKYYPVFIMAYTSPQGRSSNQSEFKFNSNNINHLISEIEYKLSKRIAKGYERTKLTPAIRESILVRDNFTCCKCGNSQYKEPNLLLEVDHIIPISKGGKTEPNNLQTLCWRCNRKKSDNI